MSMLIQTTWLKEIKETNKKEDKHKPQNKTNVRDFQKNQRCFTFNGA